MMFFGSRGFTATHGSSSLFTQLTSPGNRNAEMSHDANGLVLDAWLTDVVAYGPAEATDTGSRNTRAASAAAYGMPFLMLTSPDRTAGASCRPLSEVSTERSPNQGWPSRFGEGCRRPCRVSCGTSSKQGGARERNQVRSGVGRRPGGHGCGVRRRERRRVHRVA